MFKLGFYLITTIRLSVLKVLAGGQYLQSVLLAPFQHLPVFPFPRSFSLPFSGCNLGASLACFRVPVFGSGFAFATQGANVWLMRVASNNKGHQFAACGCRTRSCGARRCAKRCVKFFPL